MTGEHAQPSTGGPTTSDCLRGSGEGMVHLLTATKIPAGYRKMVRVQLVGDSSPHLVMFTPRSVADQVLFVDAVFAGSCATLVATNKGTQAVHLEAGTTLGTAAPIDEEDIMDGGEDVVEGSGGGDGRNVIEGGAGGGGMVKKSGAGGEGTVKKSGAGGEGMVKKSGAGGGGMVKKSGAGGGGMVKKSGAGGEGMVKRSGASGEGMVKRSGAGGEGMVKKSGAGGEDVVGKETENAGGVQELPGSEWPRDQCGLKTSELGEGPGEETPSPEVVDGGKSCESLDAAGTGAVTQGNPNMAALVVASTDPHGEQEGTEDERGDEASWPRNPGKREMETTDLKGADNQPKDDADQANCGPGYLASATRWPSSSLEGDQNGQLLQQLNLDLTHLTPPEQTKLRDCLLSSADVFALGASELGTTRLIQHGIKTGDHSPIKQPPQRVPFALRKTVDTLVEGMLSQGVVVPSASPWASPVVLV